MCTCNLRVLNPCPSPPPLGLWALHSKSLPTEILSPCSWQGQLFPPFLWCILCGIGSKSQPGCFRAPGLGKELGVCERRLRGPFLPSPASCQLEAQSPWPHSDRYCSSGSMCLSLECHTAQTDSLGSPGGGMPLLQHCRGLLGLKIAFQHRILLKAVLTEITISVPCL